jgi:Polyketide cyclase / dehydrase and lipid transport
MQTLDRDSRSRHIAAPPAIVYDIVADVTRTPSLSPEIVACRWLDGATGPAVGARFEATNHAGRGPDWKNRPVVTIATPGREFAFSRTERFAGTIVWRYVFAPTPGGGCQVTESYEVVKPVSWLGWFVIGTLYGQPDRRGDLARGMTQTLDRLKAVAEREASGLSVAEPG